MDQDFPITFAEFGRRVGMSGAWVGVLVARGKIPAVENEITGRLGIPPGEVRRYHAAWKPHVPKESKGSKP